MALTNSDVMDLMERMDQVNVGILVGGMKAATNVEYLQANRVNAILSVIHPSSDLEYSLQRKIRNIPGVKHQLVPIKNEANENLLAKLPKCFKFLDKHFVGGCSVLIHCELGLSTSPAVAIAFIMYRLETAMVTSFWQVRDARPEIQLNPGFLFQLRVFDFMGKKFHWDDWSYRMFRYQYFWAVCGRREFARPPAVPPGEPVRCRNCTMSLFHGCDRIDHMNYREKNKLYIKASLLPRASYKWVMRPFGTAFEFDCSGGPEYVLVLPLEWMQPQFNQLVRKNRFDIRNLKCVGCGRVIGFFSTSLTCHCGALFSPGVKLKRSELMWPRRFTSCTA